MLRRQDRIHQTQIDHAADVAAERHHSAAQ